MDGGIPFSPPLYITLTLIHSHTHSHTTNMHTLTLTHLSKENIPLQPGLVQGNTSSLKLLHDR